MGDGARANDVGILYCCAPPSVHMHGMSIPSAYAVRSSPDYVWGVQGRSEPLKLPTVQWAVGPDNAFHWSGLGLLPYKDTFFSNRTSRQHAGDWTNDTQYWPQFYGYSETNAATHALMSLLSMASVTFSDAVGESNRTLLMQLIREDGMLLKPDRPCTAMDVQFQAMMFGDSHRRAPSETPKERVERLFRKTGHMLSRAYEMAYATSDLLMEMIERKREECPRGYGAPQGPSGEIYSTHASIRTASGRDMTWRYVVAVQVSEALSIDARALGIADAEVKHVYYRYDDTRTFRPDTAANLERLPLPVPASASKECLTGPLLNVMTPCYDFRLFAVAPVASNGWVLTGEVGKLLPMSNARVASIDVQSGGGFAVHVKGAPGEEVMFGAVDTASGSGVEVMYRKAVIGEDGTGVVELMP